MFKLSHSIFYQNRFLSYKGIFNLILLANLNAFAIIEIPENVSQEICLQVTNESEEGLKSMNPQLPKKESNVFKSIQFFYLNQLTQGKYNEDFIACFPTDSNIIRSFNTYFVSEKACKMQVSPFSMISNLALEGNDLALNKFLFNIRYSGGGIGEDYCETLILLLQNNPEKTISRIFKFNYENRIKIYECLNLYTKEELSGILMYLKSIKKVMKEEVFLHKEIINFIENVE